MQLPLVLVVPQWRHCHGRVGSQSIPDGWPSMCVCFIPHQSYPTADRALFNKYFMQKSIEKHLPVLCKQASEYINKVSEKDPEGNISLVQCHC